MKQNCPFYGCSGLKLKRLPELYSKYLFMMAPNPHSNQCGLMSDSHTPCMLETEGRGVEWEDCERVRFVRGD